MPGGLDRLASRNTLTKVCWNTPVRWGIRLLPTYLADAWPARMLAAESELQGSKGKHSMKHAWILNGISFLKRIRLATVLIFWPGALPSLRDSDLSGGKRHVMGTLSNLPYIYGSYTDQRSFHSFPNSRLKLDPNLQLGTIIVTDWLDFKSSEVFPCLHISKLFRLLPGRGQKCDKTRSRRKWAFAHGTIQ